MANRSLYNEIIQTLEALKKEHPSYNMGRHISTALSEYGDVWGLSDKEFLFALNKYRSELDYTGTEENDLEKIIEDGKNLDKLLQNGDLFREEEDEDEF